MNNTLWILRFHFYEGKSSNDFYSQVSTCLDGGDDDGLLDIFGRCDEYEIQPKQIIQVVVKLVLPKLLSGLGKGGDSNGGKKQVNLLFSVLGLASKSIFGNLLTALFDLLGYLLGGVGGLLTGTLGGILNGVLGPVLGGLGGLTGGGESGIIGGIL